MCYYSLIEGVGWERNGAVKPWWSCLLIPKKATTGAPTETWQRLSWSSPHLLIKQELWVQKRPPKLGICSFQGQCNSTQKQNRGHTQEYWYLNNSIVLCRFKLVFCLLYPHSRQTQGQDFNSFSSLGWDHDTQLDITGILKIVDFKCWMTSQ